MKTDLDIFGMPITEPFPRSRNRRNAQRPKGYPCRPGTGPAGETCRTCQHATRVHQRGRNYYKCARLRFRWTHGPGTDIRLKTPACELWETRTDYHTGDIVRVVNCTGPLARSRRCRIYEPTCSPSYYLVTPYPRRKRHKAHAVHTDNLRLIRAKNP